MKRVIVLLLLFCYMMPAIGVSLTAHYCGGKLASISLFHHDGPGCPCGKMPMKKDCCKDKTTFIKLNDNQYKMPALALGFSKGLQTTPPFLPWKLDLLSYLVPVNQYHYLHPPDLPSGQQLWLLHEVFLI
ncbi:MAG: hypothetical protein SH808_03690 [Saprospiraceae bacterium]|nr:hypothetical protein [Saprospiraceae bacterium]